MEGRMRRLLCWRVFSLLALQLNVTSISADPFIYGLCNVNKYSNGSAYESNVNALLKYLVRAAAPRGGFARYSYGGINGLLQCRPDVSQEDCQKCSGAASQTAYQGCPNAIGARIQLEFCFIRYENYNFASVLDTVAVAALENDKSNGDIEGFNQTLGNLMNTLSGKAPFTVNRFATGSSSVVKSDWECV